MSFLVVFHAQNCAVHSDNPTVSSVYVPSPRWHRLKALNRTEQPDEKAVLRHKTRSSAFRAVCFTQLTLNTPSGVPPGPQTVTFCDAVVTITTDVLLISVCVRHQLKVNIM
jgi:hypothetical protein